MDIEVDITSLWADALSHLSESQVDLPNSTGDEQTGGDLGDSASVMAPAHLTGGQDTSARVRNTWQGWKKFEGVPIGFKIYITPREIRHLGEYSKLRYGALGTFLLGMMTLASFYASWGEHLQTVLIVIVAAFTIMYIQTMEGSLKRNGGANGATMSWVLGFFWSNGIENGEVPTVHNV